MDRNRLHRKDRRKQDASQEGKDLEPDLSVDGEAEQQAAESEERVEEGEGPAVQLRRTGAGDVSGDVHSIAAGGVGGGGHDLPHRAAIEASFGRSVGATAHLGATDACDQLGAQAYASGSQVAFRDQSPDLHTAAHEAAHVVQQQQGVQLKDGLGSAGDQYETQADAAADLVVQGKSASHLFGGAQETESAGGAKEASGGGDVQLDEAGEPVFDELDRAYDHAGAHARVVYDTRGVGIEELIGNLNEANSPTIAGRILQTLAIAGLAAASEAIAGAMVVRLAAAGASELMQALIKEAASDGLKDATTQIAGTLGGTPSNSKVSFLAAQKSAIIKLRGASETKLADRRAAAKTLVRGQTGQARTTTLAQVTAAGWEVGNKLQQGVETAQTTQYIKSLSSWLDAQARSSLGANDKSEGADLSGEVDNHPKQNVGGGSGNGVLYISYGMSQNKRPTGGTMFVRGMTDAVRDRLADVPLRDLDIPIVATGFITDGGVLDAMSVAMNDDNQFGMGRNPGGHVWVSAHEDATEVAKKLTGAGSAVEAARIILEQDLGSATLRNAHTGG